MKPLRRVLGRKFKVWTACIGFGASYGAVCGAALGTLFFPVLGTVLGACVGAQLGVVCGAVAGIAGILIGGRAGWCIAGVLGGLTPLAVLLDLSEIWNAGFALFAAVTLPIGGLLGLALSGALRSGGSRVPGIEQLAAVIREAAPLPDSASPPGLPTEVMPAHAPEGRGNEAAPVL